MAAIRKTVIPYVFARWDTSGKRGRGKWGPGRLWVLFLAIAAIVLSHQTAAAPTKEVRRILILNEVNSSYPAIPLINQRIQAALDDPLYHLEFYFEYLDSVLFPDPAVQQEFRDFYLRKYLEVHSRPMGGTRIDAWLPFKGAGPSCMLNPGMDVSLSDPSKLGHFL